MPTTDPTTNPATPAIDPTTQNPATQEPATPPADPADFVLDFGDTVAKAPVQTQEEPLATRSEETGQTNEKEETPEPIVEAPTPEETTQQENKTEPANETALEELEIPQQEGDTSTPAEIPTEPLAEPQTEAPAETTIETPTETQAEAPTETPIETPTETQTVEPSISEEPQPVETQPEFQPEIQPETPTAPVNPSAEEQPQETPQVDLAPSGIFKPLQGDEDPNTSTTTPTIEPTAEISTPFNDTPAETTQAAPQSTYEPTAEAFNQTLNALNTAKENGENVIMSDQLNASVFAEEPAKPEETGPMLSLDEMLAKKNGELPTNPENTTTTENTEMPAQEPSIWEAQPAPEGQAPAVADAFEPMKQAIEEYEKKQLEKDNINPEGIPLVIDVPPEEKNIPEPAQPEIQIEEPAPAEVPATISLDQIQTPEIAPTPAPDPIPEQTPAPAPQPAPTSSSLIDKIKQPKTLILIGALVAAGIAAYFLLMQWTTSAPTINTPTITTPTDTIEPDLTIPEEESDLTLTGDTTTSPEFSEGDMEEGFWVAEEIGEGTDRATGQPSEPFQPDSEITDSQISSEELPSAEELSLLFSNYAEMGNSYLDIGESQNDIFLVKFGGYLAYHGNLLANNPPLDIQEYSILKTRMNDILTKLNQYLDGSYDPTAASSQTETATFDQAAYDEAAYEEIKNFVDAQGGLI